MFCLYGFALRKINNLCIGMDSETAIGWMKINYPLKTNGKQGFCLYISIGRRINYPYA